MRVTHTENAVLIEIRVRKVAENIWQAFLADDPELSSLGISPGVAREELKSVVSIALGVPTGIILFTTGEAPFGNRNARDVEADHVDFEAAGNSFRLSRNDNLRIARDAIRRLIVEDCLTLAQAAEIVGISPNQVVALVEG